jgi:hypothetical protein
MDEVDEFSHVSPPWRPEDDGDGKVSESLIAISKGFAQRLDPKKEVNEFEPEERILLNGARELSNISSESFSEGDVRETSYINETFKNLGEEKIINAERVKYFMDLWEKSPKFDEISAFYKGHAASREGDQWGIIDHLGNWVLSPRSPSLRIVRPNHTV